MSNSDGSLSDLPTLLSNTFKVCDDVRVALQVITKLRRNRKSIRHWVYCVPLNRLYHVTPYS